MHKGDTSALTAIDTERGGDVVVNMKISGIGQNLSSFVYLDDIALKDNGRQSFLLTVLWKACMDIITFTDMNHLTASGRKKAFRR
ncbi:hypothetical protein D7V82_08825 [bacterium 1xD8-6]|nr:hypothetical protein D7V72_09260 [bacterium D16-36]RKI69816.1 hypothetical protein D7V82_08825 [bacterium 1xD8-6]